ncbi:MAG: Magnesium transporter [Parcubacteria group bacterium]|nr:Magnesium transporter [Parcubacteria group bacterium]
MITRHVRSGITWVDMESPTRQELDDVIAEFGIDPRIEEEIISPTPYPVVVDTENYVYLVLHFPTTDPNGGAKSQEIDFIAGKHFLITCRYELITTIHSLHKVFESEELLGIGGKRKPSNADLIERVLRHLYSAISEEAEQFARMLERIEEDIFSGRERATVRSISLVGRVLLRFDTTLARHTEPLKEFLKQLSSPVFFGKSFEEHAAHIEAEHTHAITIVTSYREVAAELRETNDSILSTLQNEIIQRLTVVTFAAVPLTIIAGLFGMNISGIPLANSSHGFFVVVGLMVITVLVLITYFKAKKWI